MNVQTRFASAIIFLMFTDENTLKIRRTFPMACNVLVVILLTLKYFKSRAPISLRSPYHHVWSGLSGLSGLSGFSDFGLGLGIFFGIGLGIWFGIGLGIRLSIWLRFCSNGGIITSAPIFSIILITKQLITGVDRNRRQSKEHKCKTKFFFLERHKYDSKYLVSSISSSSSTMFFMPTTSIPEIGIKPPACVEKPKGAPHSNDGNKQQRDQTC